MKEFYDETTESFTYMDAVVLDLEHSLVALSKWESKFEKPFLGPDEKTTEETLGYVEAMIINDAFPQGLLDRFNQEHFTKINNYIDSRQSATTFSNTQHRSGRPEIITAELIYYWMVSFNIPLDCENWHLNRLFSLIQICNIKNSKQKNMPRSEIAARNRALNEQRKAQMRTTG
jgi:hypothetical protein